MLDGNSSLGSDPPESDSDAHIDDDLDQQSRLPVKRRSELYGDATLNPKRRRRQSATFNTDGASVAAGQESTDRAIVHSWLSSLDVSQNYNAARRRHQLGTGSWFIDGKQFVDWKADPEAILCIYGKPGSGKTILCSYIIEHVKDMCKYQIVATECQAQ
ncbi:hypothetical protein FIBSPDRAFT_191646 [Athelia psychrophila]|uniref:Nephrocystin 3-like N-terminal domain-containing protein n=1 Tax=Athelia psychrophila TaxID=1759441 RepID=A0A165ZZV0_9AGAM|nr:hypothetical protein FIBSPDRAFT_191646 [Fibularhizoctonia sp. CBS 109695]